MKNILSKIHAALILISCSTVSLNASAACYEDIDFGDWYNDFGDLFLTEAECLASEDGGDSGGPVDVLTSTDITRTIDAETNYVFQMSDFTLFDSSGNPLAVTAIAYNYSAFNGVLYRDLNGNDTFDGGDEASVNGNLLSSVSSGSLKYMPNSGSGDEFDYIALFLYNDMSDPVPMLTTINVTAAANNTPQIDSNIQDYTLDEDFTEFDISVSISHADEDALMLTVNADDNSIFTLTPKWNTQTLQADDYSNKELVLTVTAKADQYGSSKVTLLLIDEANQQVTKDFLVTVNAVNDAPKITGTPSTSVNQGATYNFVPTATDSDVGDSKIFSIENKPSWLTFNTTTGELSGTPSQSDIGTYSGIIVSVTDSENAKASLSAFNITVVNVNDAPVVSMAKSYTTDEDISVGLNYTVSDADDDLITITSSSPALGTVNTETQPISYTPNQNQNGTDSFTLTFDDGNGGIVTKSVTVTINPVNDVPVISGGASSSVDQGTTYNFIPTVTDSDAGDSKIFSIENKPSWLTFNTTTGELSGTPSQSDVGTHGGIIISVTDSENAKAALSAFNITVVNVNDIPLVTIEPSFTTEEDTAVTLSYSASDVDGDLITITSSKPANGVVNIINQDVIYTPNQNKNGTDSFILTFDDGNGGIVKKTINIEVHAVNDAPEIGGIPQGTINQGAKYSFIPVVTDNDQGDTKTFSITNKPTWLVFNDTNGELSGTPGQSEVGKYDNIVISVTDSASLTTALQPFSIEVINVNDAPVVTIDEELNTPEDTPATLKYSVSDVDGDTVKLTYTQSSIGAVSLNEVAHEITFTPTKSGSDSFTVTFNDGNGGVVTKTIKVITTAVNKIPVVIINETLHTPEDTSATLKYSVSDPNGDTVKVNYTQATIGTVSLDEVNNEIIYTPTESGSDSFMVTFDDGNGGIVTKTIKVVIGAVNKAPVVTIDETLQTLEDTSATLTYSVTDPDGDTVSVTFKENTEGTVSINATANEVTYTPAENVNGTDSFSLIFDDGNGAKITKEIKVTIDPVNDELVVEIETSLTVVEATTTDAEAVELAYKITDKDEDVISIDITINPELGSLVIDREAQKVLYTPFLNKYGSDSFTLKFSDGNGSIVDKVISVEISAVERILEISGEPLLTIYQFTEYSFVPVVSESANEAENTFTITNKPDWLEFDSSTGKLSGTPKVVGDYTGITITVNNGSKSATLPAFAIEVLEPVIQVAEADNGYLWNEQLGWIYLQGSKTTFEVYPDHLEGYIWSPVLGWIELGSQHQAKISHTYLNTSSSDWGINIDSSGQFSGYGWNEKIGWIDFNSDGAQVNLNKATGEISGYAWNEQVGWIAFSSDVHTVKLKTKEPDPVAPSPGSNAQDAITSAQNANTNTELKDTTETDNSYVVTTVKDGVETKQEISKNGDNVVKVANASGGATFVSKDGTKSVSINQNGTTQTSTKNSSGEVSTVIANVSAAVNITPNSTTTSISSNSLDEGNNVTSINIQTISEGSNSTTTNILLANGGATQVSVYGPSTTVINGDGTIQTTLNSSDYGQINMISQVNGGVSISAGSSISQPVVFSLPSNSTIDLTTTGMRAITSLPLTGSVLGSRISN
ncbi:tandem-95 repeat protein [Catenovulum sp. 2E275]|uniref:tandem-95 repeat protein n=1 Tax=Catenovulum sp. 2E275 TaxID=2980497 RepID=UPI0021CFCB42|nr:tandem-95 repeat protein [Catenovulum sp. 2E275]MCU4675489.1 tandem-95 repeat protein [Catenovulum sp. 2E275]